MWKFGCLAVLILPLAAVAMVVASAPEAFALAGFYAWVIGKTGVEQMTSYPLFGTVTAVRRTSTASGAVEERAEVAFTLPSGEKRTAILTRKPASRGDAWYRGQPMPILVSRVDPTRIRYDEAWALRPEGQRRLQPIKDLVLKNAKGPKPGGR